MATCTVNLSPPENGAYDADDVCGKPAVQTVVHIERNETKQFCAEHAWNPVYARELAKHGWYVAGDKTSKRVARVYAAWLKKLHVAMVNNAPAPPRPPEIR